MAAEFRGGQPGRSFSRPHDGTSARLLLPIGLQRFTLHEQDYGGPIGCRLALAHPERIRAIIVQNAVAHEVGLGPAWDVRRVFWADRDAHKAAVIPPFLSLAGARQRHMGSSPHRERYDPNIWLDEHALLSRPGQERSQSDLFYDYQSNVAAYPVWQAWLREHQPPLLGRVWQ